MDILFVVIIVFSVVFHEVAHGYAAFLLGDPTAKQEGRLTLNPIPHIDLIGTILLPALLILFQAGILFGWAKPVPYNPYNLRHRYGEAMVAGAGPLVNIALALLFAFLFAFVGPLSSFAELFSQVVYINLFLAVLNLLPIPPLDGSKIFPLFLPLRLRMILEERFGSLFRAHTFVFIILVFVFLLFFGIEYLAYFVLFLSFIFQAFATVSVELLFSVF